MAATAQAKEATPQDPKKQRRIEKLRKKFLHLAAFGTGEEFVFSFLSSPSDTDVEKLVKETDANGWNLLMRAAVYGNIHALDYTYRHMLDWEEPEKTSPHLNRTDKEGRGLLTLARDEETRAHIEKLCQDLNQRLLERELPAITLSPRDKTKVPKLSWADKMRMKLRDADNNLQEDLRKNSGLIGVRRDFKRTFPWGVLGGVVARVGGLIDPVGLMMSAVISAAAAWFTLGWKKRILPTIVAGTTGVGISYGMSQYAVYLKETLEQKNAKAARIAANSMQITEESVCDHFARAQGKGYVQIVNQNGKVIRTLPCAGAGAAAAAAPKP